MSYAKLGGQHITEHRGLQHLSRDNFSEWTLRRCSNKSSSDHYAELCRLPGCAVHDLLLHRYGRESLQVFRAAMRLRLKRQSLALINASQLGEHASIPGSLLYLAWTLLSIQLPAWLTRWAAAPPSSFFVLKYGCGASVRSGAP